MANATSAKRPARGKGRDKARAPRIRFTKAELREYGMEGRTLADLSHLAGCPEVEFTLWLRRKDGHRQAWERGRLLFNLRRLGRIGSSFEEAGQALGLGARTLSDLVKGDPELLEVWQGSRIATLQGLQAVLLTKAEAGSIQALNRAIDRFGRDLAAERVSWRSLTMNQTAEAFSVSRQTVHEWSRKGAPRNADGSFHLARLIEWRVEDLIGRGGGAEPGPGWLDRRTRARAELDELKLKRERGEVLDRTAVVFGLLARLQAVVSAMDGRPVQLAAILEGKRSRKIAEVLGAEFDRIRSRMAELPAELKLSPGQQGRLEELMGEMGSGGK